ncbi:hypothetical protein IW261DRAFT_1125423 [Armillaria novae-zelandiae]|uniref:Secreted protein n=1 Tax=Armillaria novae-zelandiae TaxID=153914 RepID=A0AA39UFQ2_9AGAR|nr:hypothetical protein IW261DRAFT_1125423 [Armillaria novae-zelandiae]
MLSLMLLSCHSSVPSFVVAVAKSPSKETSLCLAQSYPVSQRRHVPNDASHPRYLLVLECVICTQFFGWLSYGRLSSGVSYVPACNDF